MSIEALLERVAVGLERVADNQERLIAGQQAAIEKIEQPKAKRETKAEKEAREKAEAAAAGDKAPAAEEPKGNAENAATASGAGAASNASDGPTDEQLKATAVAWVGQVTEPEQKTGRAEWLQRMVKSLLGVPADSAEMLMLTGPDSKLTADDRKKAVFFIKRAHKLGGTEHVDFTAPYDFDEAPDQDAPRVEPEAAPAAEFDPLG